MACRHHNDLSMTRLRSSITNGTELLSGLDHRSSWARRYRDLITLLGAADQTEAQRVLVKRAAQLTLQLELLEQRFSDNEGGAASTQDLLVYQRVTNTLRRTLQALGPLDERHVTDEALSADDLRLEALIAAEAASS